MGRVRPAEDHHGLDSLPDILSQGRIADRANEAHGHGVKLTQGCQMHKLKICPLPGFKFLQGRGTANFGPEQDTEDSSKQMLEKGLSSEFLGFLSQAGLSWEYPARPTEGSTLRKEGQGMCQGSLSQLPAQSGVLSQAAEQHRNGWRAGF